MQRLSRLIQRANHFKLFNIPERFKIDEFQLKKSFLTLQRDAHPDKGGTGQTDYSANINTAYKTLKTPIERGLYMISLRDESKTLESLQSPTDVEFLMDMMDLNEELEEAESVEAKERFHKENNERRVVLIEEIEKKFDEDSDYESAMELLAQLKYLESMNQRVIDKF